MMVGGRLSSSSVVKLNRIKTKGVERQRKNAQTSCVDSVLLVALFVGFQRAPVEPDEPGASCVIRNYALAKVETEAREGVV